MDANRNNPKKMLDEAIEAIRNTEVDSADMENRSARVWARIGNELHAEQPGAFPAEQLRTCDDYRSLIPEYAAGRLSPARALLFKDHTLECVTCRTALNAARGDVGQVKQISDRPVRRINRTVAAMAVAATLILGIVLQQAGYLNFLLPVAKVEAVARTIDGQLYKISDLNLSPVRAGDALGAGEAVRTAAGSGSVIELADGTRIEMRERSQLSLTGTYDGVQINLDRGSVIVEAAKQRDGHLYVATDDAMVSVVGTVFAVSSGVKGSRVSVLEGQVKVAQNDADERALNPGEQVTTGAVLPNVTIEQEISWSKNLDTHLALLRAVADVNAFLRNRVPGPALRFNSTLLPLVPADTVMYAAFPNLSNELGQAYDLFRQKIDQNASLRTWWAEETRQQDSTDPTLEEMIQHARNVGSYLGEEIAIAITGNSSGPDDIILLANVRNAQGIVGELNTILARAGENIRVLTDPAQLATFTGAEQDPVAYVGGSVLVLASSPQALYKVVVAQASGKSGFSTKPFYSSIAQVYSQGAASLFAADVATLLAEEGDSPEAAALGLTSIDRLVVEQKQVAGKTTTRAQLNLTGPRSGMVSWLAPPAPMGALEFVSPQAYGIASAVTKDAGAIFDELLSAVTPNPEASADLAEFERETGINVRRDLAAPLGGEFLFAMDGPFLPTPSWKVVAEVYDSARLQNTIEWLVSQMNTRAAERGEAQVTLRAESVNGQVYHMLRRADGTGLEVHYTYALGYIVAGASRALVSQALQYQQSRSSIAESRVFRSMMPADGGDHCSAILYQNLMEAANSIINYVPAVGGITADQVRTLRQTIELTPPTLVCAAGESNRIVMGYQGDLGLNVLMLGGLRSMMQTVWNEPE